MRSPTQARCWWSTRPRRDEGSRLDGCATPVHRHRRPDRDSQVAEYLTYAAPRAHALTDGALYLPRSWAEDRDRCTRAGIPEDSTSFATKPAPTAGQKYANDPSRAKPTGS
jgi:hypothetical protein